MKMSLDKLLRWASSAALSVAALSVFGTLCRTWMYQPTITANMFEIE